MGRQQGFSKFDSASPPRAEGFCGIASCRQQGFRVFVGHFGCSSAVVLSVQNVSVHKETLVLIISSRGWRRCLKHLSSLTLLHLFFSLVFHLLPLCFRLVVGMRLISGILPD